MSGRQSLSGSAPAPPLLDRLIGELGARGRYAPSGEIDMREAVRRDLENLLNTRWRFLSGAPELAELDRSLIQYGIPDFTGASFADAAAQRDFRLTIQRAIQTFEPRLRALQVTLLDRGDWDRRALRFRIEAVVVAGSSQQRAIFESHLDPTSSTFRVGAPGA